MEALYSELSKRVEAATSSYPAMGDFLHIYFVFVAIIRRSDQGF